MELYGPKIIYKTKISTITIYLKVATPQKSSLSDSELSDVSSATPSDGYFTINCMVSSYNICIIIIYSYKENRLRACLSVRPTQKDTLKIPFFLGHIVLTVSHQTKPNQTKPNQTKPNQTKPNRTKPNQTKPNQTKPNQTKL